LVLARLAGEAGSTGVDGIFSVRAGGDWLRIGQVLRFSLRRPLREGVFPVPYQAVYGGDRVYVMEAGVLRGHPVEPVGEYAAADGERLLVKAPSVTAGDQLVLTHLPNAVEGLKIEAVSDR
jgi:HlyD family secretion protein